MEKINNRGKVKFAVAMIIITGCFAVASKVLIIDPQYIDRVKTNKIYIGGFEKNILMKTIRDFISNSKRMVLLLQCKMIAGGMRTIIMKMEPVGLRV